MTKRGSLTKFVYDILRRAILEQRLRPGTKLPEDAIGEELGVSRTVVRRAIDLLRTEELVDIKPNRTASVINPTIEEAKDIFAVRMDMERLVIERLCGRVTAEQEKYLVSCIRKEESAHKNKQSDYIVHAVEFHILLAEMTGSALLEKYIRSLVIRSPIILGLYGRPNWPECSMQEHRDIVAALVKGDKNRATGIMSEHLDGLLTRALDTEPEDGSNLRTILGAYASSERKTPSKKRARTVKENTQSTNV